MTSDGLRRFGADLLGELHMSDASFRKQREARERYLAFQKAIHPRYTWSWHHERIADALEDVTRYVLTGRGTDRLIVTMPPRHSKSTMVSEGLTPWLLGRALTQYGRHLSVILASYNKDKASKFGLAALEIVRSDVYRSIFPGVTISSQQSAAGNWKIEGSNQQTSMLSTGVGGSATGYGAHLLVIDDPIRNAVDAASETVRENQWEWYTRVARTRLMPNGTVIICMTRWHYDDLVGKVLENNPDRWEVLHLKALADEDEEYRNEGEALWPSFYDAPTLRETREEMTERPFSTLYQGEPVPDGGNLLKVDWLQHATYSMWKASRDWPVVYGVDPAGEGDDWTAIAKIRWDVQGGKAIVADVIRGRWDFAQIHTNLRAHAAMDAPIRIVIESNNFQAWLGQHMKATTSLNITKSPTRQSKKVRFSSFGAMGAQFQSGYVLLPPEDKLTPGLVQFMKEWGEFDAGKHDDTLDAVEKGLQGAMLSQRKQQFENRLRFAGVRTKRENPYGDLPPLVEDVDETLDAALAGDAEAGARLTAMNAFASD